MPNSRWAVVGLGLLTCLTAVLVVLAFLHVRPRAVTSGAAIPVDQPASTQPTASTASRSATPSPEATPRPESTPTQRRHTTKAIRAMLRTDPELQVVVIGDETGAGESGWVTQWAKAEAKTRTVTLTGADRSEPGKSMGSGRTTLSLRNISKRGLTLADAMEQVDKTVTAQTDLVILNVGHHEQTGSLARKARRVWSKLPAATSGLLILQNPEASAGQQAQRDRVRELADWADANQAPVVDVYSAFVRAPEPLSELLADDNITPNAKGGAVWKNELLTQLG